MKGSFKGGRILLVVAIVAALAGIAAVPAQAAPACDATKCATVSGSVTRGPWDSNWGRYQWVQFHASCTHSSLLGGTGNCYADGSSGTPCSMGLLGVCTSHAHWTRYGVYSGTCVIVEARTSDSLGSISDVHMACA